mgnify:CR=1 FL=1
MFRHGERSWLAVGRGVGKVRFGVSDEGSACKLLADVHGEATNRRSGSEAGATTAIIQ